MQENTIQRSTSVFASEVREGLTAFPKRLSSKYFYDQNGDRLFQKIMAMPEYYLTDAEFEILETHKARIADHFCKQGEAFELFELGAGDGKKTKILLEHFVAQGFQFDYRPIDISQNALDNLRHSINKALPEVSVKPLQGSYFETLKNIGATNGKKKIILFLGSNIGNLLHPDAIAFLRQLKEAMNSGDLLLMGMDQKKNPQTILEAYNDKTGITEAFNKNILRRINTELGGNFDLDTFLHWETYDPESGTAKSYLVAKEAQKVTLSDIDLEINFEPWETIHTEISQKYDDATVAWMSEAAGLDMVTAFVDRNNLFKDYLFQKK